MNSPWVHARRIGGLNSPCVHARRIGGLKLLQSCTLLHQVALDIGYALGHVLRYSQARQATECVSEVGARLLHRLQ